MGCPLSPLRDEAGTEISYRGMRRNFYSCFSSSLAFKYVFADSLLMPYFIIFGADYYIEKVDSVLVKC